MLIALIHDPADAGGGPDARPIRAQVALVDGEGFSRFDSAREKGHVARQIVRVSHILDPQGQQLFTRPAQHGAEPVIDHPEAPIGTGLRQSHLCLVEDRGQKTFAFAQGVLRHLPVGDIETETADARGTAILAGQDLTTDLVPAGAVSRMGGPVLDPEIADRLFKAFPQRKLHPLPVIGMNLPYPGGAGGRHGLLSASAGIILAARP